MDILVLICCFTLASAQPGGPPVIKEQPSSVVARRNDPATLNCAASKGSHISWFRDGEEVVTSTQDSRSHRVLLPSGSLFFLRVTATRRDNDGGTYWCIASNNHGATRSHNATLTVATLAYEFQKLTDPITKIRIGESVNLTCRPPKGTPPPKVTWLRNGNHVTNSSRISVTEVGDLDITRAVQQDSAEYVCRARNAAGTREASPSRLIIMTPPWFKKRPSNLTVASGVDVELECLVEGSPSPTVSWRRLDGKMPLGSVSVKNQQLMLRQVAAEDSGVYVCKAESEAGVVAAEATLMVLDTPELTQKPQNQQVMVGEEAKLRCRVEGTPEPIVLWRLPTLDRTAVLPSGHSNGHVTVSGNGSTLLIQQAATQDSGSYYCWGISSGGGVSGQADVLVVSALPPPVVGVGPNDLTVAPGGIATFPCETVSEAMAASVTWWYRPDTHLPQHQLGGAQSQSRYSLPENGALIIKDVQHNDAGIYSCQVKAATGSVQKEAVLSVTEDAVQQDSPLLPPPPSKPRVLGLNQTAVNLSWLPNSQRGEARHYWYSVEFWREGWKEWRLAEPVITQESCVINQLTPGHTYTFLVRAVNSQGASFPSPWSAPITTHTSHDSSLTASQVRQAHRRLTRPVVTLTTAEATAPDSVQLSWSFLLPVEEWVEGVLVYWFAEGGNVQVATVLGTSSTSHLHHLFPNTLYTFFLVPFWRSIEGTPSNCYSLTTPEDVPVEAPDDVRVKQQDEGSVLIRWSSLSEEKAQGKVVGYLVTLSHNGSHTKQTVESPWMEARGLLPGHIYTLRVAAITGAGVGPFSNPMLLKGQRTPDVTLTEGNGESVLYAAPQAAWLAYLLIPLVLLLLLLTLWYLQRLREKEPTSNLSQTPALYQDPSINMYNDQKLWRPSESDKDSSLSSSKLLRQDQLVHEYAEARVQQPNQTAEPYATTALLAPPSPRKPWHHHSDDSGVQVNWSAILPPPPACPPPDLDLEEPHHQESRQACSTSSQYDKIDGLEHYRRPCDTTSEHTYEPYMQVAPPDMFLTFSGLQSHGDCKGQGESHIPQPSEHLRSQTQ